MAETIGDRLAQMHKDLISLVDRINRDGEVGIATKAQLVLNQLDDLEGDISSYSECSWDWQPEER